MLYSEALPKSAASAGAARRVVDRLRGRVPDEHLANARLLVSELVANAVEHVPEDGEIGLRVAFDDGVLRVEVRDPGHGFTPAPRRADASISSGWGLHFTRVLADRWAADLDGSARVWFEIDTG